MEQLSLPTFSYKIKESEGKTFIYDVVRRKWLVLTPEEWVRQHMVHYLKNHFGFPLALMNVERGTTYNKLQKRTDICIYSPTGRPLLLIECKAPQIPISSDTVQQAAVYNQSLQAAYLLVTNGIHHYCWRVGQDGISLEPLQELPTYDQMKEEGLWKE